MSRRVVFLLLLAVSILSLRAIQFYDACTKDYVQEGELGILSDVRNGHLSVKTIIKKRYTGKPTSGYLAGLKVGDEIVAIYNSRNEGKEIHSYFDFGEAWKTLRYDEPWSIQIVRDGKTSLLHAPAVPAPEKDFRYWFISIILIFTLPLIILFIAFFLGFAKPQDDHAFLASIFFASFSFIFGISFQYFPPLIRDFGVLLSITCVSFSAYLFTRFFLRFPTTSILERKFPWLNKVLLVSTTIFWLINVISAYSFYRFLPAYERISAATKPFAILLGVSQIVTIAAGLISLILHYVKAQSKDERRKTGIVMSGAIIGIVPLAVFLSFYSAGSATLPPFWSIVVLAISVAVFPVSFLYVVLRHRVLGIRLILRRGLQYALVSRGFFVIEGLLIFAMVYLLMNGLRVWSYKDSTLLPVLITAGVAFGVAFALRHINHRVMGGIDRRFFRHAYNTQQVLTDLARGVRKLAAQPERLFDLITDQLSDALLIDKVGIFLRQQSTVSFRCHGIRVRSGYHDEVWCGPDEYGTFCFSSDSLITQELLRFKSEEPACLEVYLNDPKSWASALMRVDPNDSLYQERILMEKMNTKLIVPLVSGEEILGFLSLGDKLSEEAYSKEDKQLLLGVGEQTAIALDYSNLISQVAEQEKLKRELQIATEVQAQLFPQIFPRMLTFEYTGYCKAARAVGGDYYDFLPLNGDSLGVALGDVSGKGISSALLMANLQALLRSGAPLRGDQIDQLMNDINRLMCASTNTHKYATFFYCVYQDTLRRLTYVNAGHNPPIVFRTDGSIEKLITGGLVVGMLPDVVYQKDVVQLTPGDILMIYSDGLTEAMNSEEVEFGEDRVIRSIHENRHLSVEGLKDRILDEVNAFVGDVPQHDDLTLVIARVL